MKSQRSVLGPSVIGLGLILAAAPVHALADNHAPSCTARTISLSAAASEYITSMNFEPLVVGDCKDPDGDTLTVVSVSAPAKLGRKNEIIIPYPTRGGESVTITYTVSDKVGAKTNSTITLKREK